MDYLALAVAFGVCVVRLSRVKHPEQVKCGQICEVVVGHLKTPLVCSSQLTRSVYTR
nr:MAG TPA: hypothetical protein [Caudoviricetes sp.]